MEKSRKYPKITVEDSRIDEVLFDLEIQRRQILDLKKQIKYLWIVLLSMDAGILIHLLNHLIFM